MSEKALTAHWHEGEHIGCYIPHDRCPTCGGTREEVRCIQRDLTRIHSCLVCTDSFHKGED